MKNDPRKGLEHDVDILLVEELNVSQSFRQWFVQESTRDDVQDLELVTAHRSWSLSEGQTDVIFVYRHRNSPKDALLIENKIGAPPGPNQGKRYRRRGERDRQKGKWVSFRTVLLAPQKYLDQCHDTQSYDRGISYESVADWFRKERPNDPRMDYKARVLEGGISWNKKRPLPMPDPIVTQFFLDYWALANREFRQLGMEKPGDVPPGSNDVGFLSKELKKGFSLKHKFEKAYVDLVLGKMGPRVDQLREENEEEVAKANREIGVVDDDNTEIRVLMIGKSAAFRVHLSSKKKMDRFLPFCDQVEPAREAMKVAKVLLKLSLRIRTEFPA